MTIEKFKQYLKYNNGLWVSDDLILFNDFELWNLKTDESITFNSLNELFEYHYLDDTFLNYILKIDAFYSRLAGGRGASSLSGRMGGGFNHASSGRGAVDADIHKAVYPAEFNALGGKNKSYDATLKAFADKYKEADREYGITIDEDGFVHRHVVGDRSSVSISGSKGEMIVHNHPSGGNFSDTDLINTSLEGVKGIVAVGSDKTYTLTKTNKFDAKGFSKAVKKATWPVEYDYNKGADWWLRKNAKKFGYRYTAKKTK